MGKREEKLVESILFSAGARFTQDTPVLPEVWLEFARRVKKTGPGTPVEVLITPYDSKDGATLAEHLTFAKGRLAHISNFAVVEVTLLELVGELIPYTSWWKDTTHSFALLDKLCKAIGQATPGNHLKEKLIWQIALNRKVKLALKDSVSTTKANAAKKVFDISCSEIGWAVVDNGVQATHKAFDPDKLGKSRVRECYDFTNIRNLLKPKAAKESKKGKLHDWSSVETELCKVDRSKGGNHGTHVAGIIGANGLEPDGITKRSFPSGLCTDIKLYDFRVFDAKDESDEFTILAALQFIRYLNNKVDVPVIHGVNLSFSIVHKVRDFACGATPICRECDRLVASGVVVVAAAGNHGYRHPDGVNLASGGYSDITITDPGNSESVITVGATHRQMPHTYGVSYFSSRGPTGDGRLKPDLVAPGEKITSIVPGGTEVMEGTSMAAPHVSGVAALLLAKYPEFRGKPQRVKEILMATATDLKREKYFQGAGLVDALRALQSV